MSKKLIVANWKMNPSSSVEAEKIWKQTILAVSSTKKNDVIVCVPFPFLYIAKKNKSKKITLGAQNVSNMASGGATGQISVSQLSSFGVSYIILGHSESRLLGETNELINQKILLSLKNKMKVILCVGEAHRDRNGFYLAYIKEQISVCLKDVPRAQVKNIVIAYEPVWAIGDKAIREATVDEFIETKIFIKKILLDIFGNSMSDVAVLYGGSVHPENAKTFLQEGDASGLLVGRDSLDSKKFRLIINS